MKTTIAATLFLLLSHCATAQNGFINIGGYGQGINLGLGANVDKVQTALNYYLPAFRTDRNAVLAFSLGYNALLAEGQNEDYRTLLTPLVGVSNLKRKDFTEYNNGGKIIYINDVKMMYGVELSKQWYHGALYTSIQKQDKILIAFGIRAIL